MSDFSDLFDEYLDNFYTLPDDKDYHEMVHDLRGDISFTNGYLELIQLTMTDADCDNLDVDKIYKYIDTAQIILMRMNAHLLAYKTFRDDVDFSDD